MMMWNVIRSQPDVDHLMQTFSGFHDSCLKEMLVQTKYHVQEDLTMVCPSELDCTVQMLLQRQQRDPSAIELRFEEVTQLHLIPHRENEDAIILKASLLWTNSLLYWSDRPGFSPERQDEGGSWIAARRAQWRDASEWMGPQMRYGVLDE